MTGGTTKEKQGDSKKLGIPSYVHHMSISFPFFCFSVQVLLKFLVNYVAFGVTAEHKARLDGTVIALRGFNRKHMGS